MGNFDLSFKLEPEDIKRGYITLDRYWELVKAAVASRGDEIDEGELIEGLGYLVTTKSGYIVHHKALPERIKVEVRLTKKERLTNL